QDRAISVHAYREPRPQEQQAGHQARKFHSPRRLLCFPGDRGGGCDEREDEVSLTSGQFSSRLDKSASVSEGEPKPGRRKSGYFLRFPERLFRWGGVI